MDLIHKKMEYKYQLLLSNIASLDIKEKIETNQSDYRMIYTDMMINKRDEKSFLQRIISENIIDEMDQFLNQYVEDPNVVKNYTDTCIEAKTVLLKVKTCTLCQSEMNISYDTLYYECLDCCLTERLSHSHSEEPLPRSRIGNFNPERHFKTWIDRILAREPEEEICTPSDPTGEKLIEMVKRHLIDKCKSIEHLTIDDIRNVLKETNKTAYNRNTSLIAKKITGRSPPPLDDHKYQLIYAMFLKVMDARDQLTNHNRCNRIYYPFYISKLLSLYTTTAEERRILNYIHLKCGDGKTSCQLHSSSVVGKTVVVSSGRSPHTQALVTVI